MPGVNRSSLIAPHFSSPCLQSSTSREPTAQTRRDLPIVLADKGDGIVLDGIPVVQQLLPADGLAFDVDAVPNTNREPRT